MYKLTFKQREDLISQLEDKIEVVFIGVNSKDGIKNKNELTYAISNKIRMERSISWLKRELAMSHEDLNMSFILHWIAFEALFSTEKYLPFNVNKNSVDTALRITTSKRISIFIKSIVRCIEDNERSREIFESDIVWQCMLDLEINPFTNPSNWVRFYKGGAKSGKRKEPFIQPTNNLKKSQLKDPNQFSKIVQNLFQQLYLVRNLIFHGNSTHSGPTSESKGKEQIQTSAMCMQFIVPALINIMLDELEQNNHSKNWGKIAYPRINYQE